MLCGSPVSTGDGPVQWSASDLLSCGKMHRDRIYIDGGRAGRRRQSSWHSGLKVRAVERAHGQRRAGGVPSGSPPSSETRGASKADAGSEGGERPIGMVRPERSRRTQALAAAVNSIRITESPSYRSPTAALASACETRGTRQKNGNPPRRPTAALPHRRAPHPLDPPAADARR